MLRTQLQRHTTRGQQLHSLPAELWSPKSGEWWGKCFSKTIRNLLHMRPFLIKFGRHVQLYILYNILNYFLPAAIPFKLSVFFTAGSKQYGSGSVMDEPKNHMKYWYTSHMIQIIWQVWNHLPWNWTICSFENPRRVINLRLYWLFSRIRSINVWPNWSQQGWWTWKAYGSSA